MAREERKEEKEQDKMGEEGMLKKKEGERGTE